MTASVNLFAASWDKMSPFRAGVFAVDGSTRVTWSSEGEPTEDIGHQAAEYLRAHGAMDLM